MFKLSILSVKTQNTDGICYEMEMSERHTKYLSNTVPVYYMHAPKDLYMRVI